MLSLGLSVQWEKTSVKYWRELSELTLTVVLFKLIRHIMMRSAFKSNLILHGTTLPWLLYKLFLFRIQRNKFHCNPGKQMNRNCMDTEMWV